MASRLTALICVRNEEARLDACLRTLAFADEIVVVLDRCTDRSKAIALAHGAHLVEGTFPLEGARRDVGAASALGDWVFEVDADELVGPQLAAEVLECVATNAFDHHAVPIDNHVGGRLIRHGWGCSFGAMSAVRLWRRGCKHWGGERVHPSVRLSGRKGPSLATPLRHDVDHDVSDMLRRLDRYTALRAQDLVESGDIGGVWDNVFRGGRRFVRCLVKYQGWREGGWGVLIALMAGLYPLLSVLRARLEGEGRHSLPVALAEPITDVRPTLLAANS